MWIYKVLAPLVGADSPVKGDDSMAAPFFGGGVVG